MKRSRLALLSSNLSMGPVHFGSAARISEATITVVKGNVWDQGTWRSVTEFVWGPAAEEAYNALQGYSKHVLTVLNAKSDHVFGLSALHTADAIISSARRQLPDDHSLKDVPDLVSAAGATGGEVMAIADVFLIVGPLVDALGALKPRGGVAGGSSRRLGEGPRARPYRLPRSTETSVGHVVSAPLAVWAGDQDCLVGDLNT